MNRPANFYVISLARRFRRARRTQYRGRDLPGPNIEGRIRDWGVVKHRDVSAIDRQLALLAAVSASIRRLGGRPSTALIDELLDERIASRPARLASIFRD